MYKQFFLYMVYFNMLCPKKNSRFFASNEVEILNLQIF